MRQLMRRSVDQVVKHTPEPVLRVLRPGLKPLVEKLLAREAAPESCAYIVRPHATPTHDGPRVLHLIGNFLTGGSSRLVVDLYERLGHRYTQQVITQVLPHPQAYLGIPVTQVAERDSVQPLLDAARRFNPDVMHVHYWGDCDTPWYSRAFEAARALGCPVIQNVNTPVQPFADPQVRRNVYVSDYVRRHFGAAGEAAETIYPGSDFSHFRPPLLYAKAPSRVGMVYRLEPDKLNAQGIEPMIHAARLDPRQEFVVVGGGTFLDEYRRRVQEAGLEARFRFTGYVPYSVLPLLYRELAIFVAPVWKESFGQVSPFAMSMGIPVVGYEVGAIGEIIDDPTLLAPPGDSEALGRIIFWLMHDPALRRSVGKHNQSRARRLFSVEAMVASYDRLYASVLAEGR